MNQADRGACASCSSDRLRSFRQPRRPLLLAYLATIHLALAWSFWPAEKPTSISSVAPTWPGYFTRSQPVPCPADALVVFTAGQSNAANSVGERFPAGPAVFQWYRGACYPAGGPLLGADSDRGSYWPLLGDLLVARGQKPVILVGAAVGGTSVKEWADPDRLGGHLARRLAEIPRVDLVLWHQGEADTQMPPDEYRSGLVSVIETVRRTAPAARMLVAQATLCSNGRESAEIRAVQASVVDGAFVLAGPNTDTLREQYRYDDCHFNAAGARAVAGMWADAVQELQRKDAR